MSSPTVIIAGWRPEIPGTRAALCHDCGRAVWLAPSGQELVRQYPGLRVLCVVCGAARAAADPAAERLPMTPAQRRELLAWLAGVHQRRS